MFGFALLELAAIACFIILMLIGIAFDRRAEESVKWWVFVLGGAFLVWVLLPEEWTFAGLGAYLISAEFLLPIAAYFGIGIAYCFVEFGVGVRRIAKKMEAAWQEYLPSRRTITVDKERRDFTVKEILQSSELAEQHGKDLVDSFINHQNLSGTFIELERGHLRPEPKVDRAELACHIGAWTFFWPFYALSLFFGDLMNIVFEWVSATIASISGRFVRMVFSDSFKV
jgi:hypothetical protein